VLKTFAFVVTLVAAGALAAAPTMAARTTTAPPAGTAEGLTDGAQLSAIYDTILQARFDEARAQLARTCPPAPSAACDILREVAIWWEIQQNPSSRQVDARFRASATAAIASATRWSEREPGRGEAWFYAAAAYAPLTQWRVLRGARLAAARDGKRMKDALERALALDSSLQDAWFGIGLYHYYADVVPAALKVLRFLLLLPGGDRVEGLQEMLRAREHGELLRGEADYQLHWLYLWYEEQPARALQLLRSLDTQYPSNPVFLQRIADVEHVYVSDHRASADSWQSLLERARSGRVAFAALAEARARVGLAAELIELSEAPRALELLDPVIRSRASEPYGVLALAQLTLGDAYASLGERAQAIDAYARAVEAAPPDDPDALRSRARSATARARSRR
jgi:tetratricopeptide (TPR) repeat protein